MHINFILHSEVGTNMQPDSMIKYTFDQESGEISTDEETIIIGFSTQEKRGQLMLIKSDDPNPDYISVELNNNGMIFPVGLPLLVVGLCL